MRTALAILALLAIPNAASAQRFVPMGVSFEVTAQATHNGLLQPAFHIFKLNCHKTECDLIVVTLNQCKPLSDGPAFYPAIESFSTRHNDLEIKFVGSSVRATARGFTTGEFVMSLRFDYRRESSPSHRLFTMYDLAGFTGGYTNQSMTGGKVTAAEYVPLEGFFVNKKLDCDVSLSGVPGTLAPPAPRPQKPI
jgi:hypothetical protein